MNSAEPLILPSQLRQARESISLTQAAAAEFIGVAEETLASWEAGLSEPTVEQLESLATLYRRGVDYFLAEYPRQPTRVFLRTLTHALMPSVELDTRKVIAEFEELCRHEWELEQMSGLENQVLITPQIGRPPAGLALFERERVGLDSQPVKDLRELLARQGVRVFWLPIPEGVFAGLSWWHVTYGPCILANSLDNPGRRVFTMAHEYGHLVSSGEESLTICDLSDIDEERYANRFATEFLMPERDVRSYWQTHSGAHSSFDIEFIDVMARRYNVSREALAIRLEELGLLPNALWLVQTAPKPRSFGRRRPNWRRTRGERYVGKALRAHQTGQLSLGKLAEFLGTDLRTALKAISGPADSTKQ